MKFKLHLLNCILIFLSLAASSQSASHVAPAGKLFIIGGGDRSPALMKKLLATAQLKKEDYIVVLPMSSEYPDTSYFYIKEDFAPVCQNPLSNLNFTKELVTNEVWLDSLRKAKLIFITGGDQGRFMDIVLNTPVHKAILAAYANGSTIAGTSAGAAVMSRKMITGNEYDGDSVRSGSFKKIRYHLVEIKEGLGLVNTAIIDQHFIARSRYNRLLSVLAESPSYPCIGIDEATAIIVSGKNVTVTGESQVIRLTLPFGIKKHAGLNDLINLKNVQLDIFTSGDHFILK